MAFEKLGSFKTHLRVNRQQTQGVETSQKEGTYLKRCVL
jgi:hypothetical protein